MMTERSVLHSTFTIERDYPFPPSEVFAAWADPDRKRSWFASGEGWTTAAYNLDFAVGGREHNEAKVHDGPTFVYDARYMDIVDGERLIYAYDMLMDGARISASLATIALEERDGGTRLTFTEQGAFLDGLDQPEDREVGTKQLLDNLARYLEKTSAPASRG